MEALLALVIGGVNVRGVLRVAEKEIGAVAMHHTGLQVDTGMPLLVPAGLGQAVNLTDGQARLGELLGAHLAAHGV